jgi:hypothetical protein
MAVQTFGVDQTHVSSFEPQITIATDAPVTPTRLAVLINASAARINGLMSFHGIDPDDTASDTTSVAYSNAQRLITDRVLVDLRGAAYGGVSVAAEILIFDTSADAQIEKWQAKPDSLGATVTDDVSPGVHTSTQALGLDTGETCRARRRRYDRARCRTSLPNDGFRW